jgi:hypothetical protein
LDVEKHDTYGGTEPSQIKTPNPYDTRLEVLNALLQVPSSVALVFTPFVMDQMQRMSQMSGGGACPYVACHFDTGNM